jgi:hypothetical protein
MESPICRGLEDIPDEELPEIGYGLNRLQRNVTTDFFTDSCSNCRIAVENGTCSLLTGTDERFDFYLWLLGIPAGELFSPAMG